MLDKNSLKKKKIIIRGLGFVKLNLNSQFMIVILRGYLPSTPIFSFNNEFIQA